MTSHSARVLQILPHLNEGGAPRGALDLADFMSKNGLKSFVCSTGGKGQSILKSIGVQHITLPVDSKNPFVIIRNISELADVIRQLNIDIVHARSRAPAWSAFYACKKLGIPFVTTFHGTYNFNNPLKKLYNSIMVRGNHVIAISDFIKKHIQRHYKMFITPETKISVIHRGVDCAYFDPGKDHDKAISALRSHLKIPQDHKIVLMAGRLTRWKGQRILIEAMSYLHRKDVTCLLVGSDQGRRLYRKELIRRIKALNLSETVRIMDSFEDMSLLYQLSDLVVHASTDPEAFGRVVAEAQAMGKPVITNDLGGSKEIILANETGWLVPAGKPEKLAEKMKFILSLTEARKDEIARKARGNILRSFSKERMCAKTVEVYESLINQ